jgi:N6-L-threonylcarbamoyladenine synthase
MPGSFDFSFSGLKTAVLYHVKKYGCEDVEDIAAGFQAAVVDVLVKKVLRAAEDKGVGSILLGGGVARNTVLRRTLEKEALKTGIGFFCPSQALCTDNAVMIAGLGFVKLESGERSSLSLNVCSNWVLGSPLVSIDAGSLRM